MATYSASDLHHRIEFLQLANVPDGGGGFTRTWASMSPPVIVPAMVKPRSSRERFMAGQTASAETVLIVIRYHPSVNEKLRIRYGTKEYSILGVIDVDERHRWIEIDAEQQHEH